MGIESAEGGRRIDTFAPKVVLHTEEPLLDASIELLVTGTPHTDELDAALMHAGGDEPKFVSRIERARPSIEQFIARIEARFEKGRGYRAGIRDALRFMLKLHADQGDRYDSGEPFVTHPLAVATDTLRMMGKREDAWHACIAALLHDSVEDHARWIKLERQLLLDDSEESHVPYEIPQEEETEEEQRQRIKKRERAEALAGLQALFDARIRYLVNRVSTPLKEAEYENLSQNEKNAIYTRFIEKIFAEEDGDVVPAVIKWADLKQNALTIGHIRERARLLREQGADNKAEELERFYEKVKVKYAPALEVVRQFFVELTNGEHPLFAEKERALTDLRAVLTKEYDA